MHEMSWRRDCLRRLPRAEVEVLFAEHNVRFAGVEARLEELAGLRPGPELIAGLLEVQGMELDCASQVRLVGLWGQVTSWAQAQSVVGWADALDGGDADSDRLVAQEIAAATHVSFGSAMNQAGLVHQVTRGLPSALAALTTGELSLAHLRALAEATRPVSDDLARSVCDRVVPRAVARGWTPAELKAAARRLLLRLDPDGAADRARKARQGEDVQAFSGDDDLATIIVTASADTVRQVTDTLEANARALAASGDPRLIGQLRVAALATAVLGPPTRRPAAHVSVTIDLHTLLGLTDTPGELIGHGPITADLARQIATDATLNRIITDPVTGTALHVSRTRYRPSALLRDLVNTRDRTCRFPGCTHPAQACDTDHLTPWPDGPTEPDNLHPLCRTHHGFKTRKAWWVQRDPQSGTSTWTSPLGHLYLRPAATYPDDAPGSNDPYPEDPDPVSASHRFPVASDRNRTHSQMPFQQRLATSLELVAAGHPRGSAPPRRRPPSRR